MLKWSAALLLILFSFNAYSQKSYTVSGYVNDSATGEAQIGAIIVVNELPTAGVATNAYGFYSISLPENSYTVTVKSVGYVSKSVTISLKENVQLNFNINADTKQLQQVVVSNAKANSTSPIQKWVFSILILNR